jgi:hypothetical protein
MVVSPGLTPNRTASNDGKANLVGASLEKP